MTSPESSPRHYDPRFIDVVVEALKRGHNADGYPIEVTIGNASIPKAPILGANERARLARLVDSSSGISDPSQLLGYEVTEMLIERVREE
jgi:hypothetical protein